MPSIFNHVPKLNLERIEVIRIRVKEGRGILYLENGQSSVINMSLLLLQWNV